MIFIVLIAVLVFIGLVLSSGKQQPVKPQQNEVKSEVSPRPIMTYPESPYKCFRIAGISNYCNRSDIGPISGELMNDPDNRYDKSAVMIVEAHKEKIIGYIPKDQKAEYRKISEGQDRRPFVGYIERFTNEDGEQRLYGIIRTYSGDLDVIMSDMENDWSFLQAAFKIKSYDERIEVLNQYKY